MIINNSIFKLGTPQLQFISRRAQFGKIPVNMPSVKTFYITNTGSHNAFFQVVVEIILKIINFK